MPHFVGHSSHNTDTMVLFPRFHLFEFIDQPWCPRWFRGYAQTFLLGLWDLHIPGLTFHTPATSVSEIIIQNFPDACNFTFVDLCAGAGGPTPIIERLLNTTLAEQGKDTAQFVLTDLYPSLQRWRAITENSNSITFLEAPLDARDCKRISPDPRQKECRMFNASFHHFDDESAIGVLKSVISEADAFVIQEGAQRDLSSLLSCTLGALIYPFIFTLATPTYRRSPVHLLFTYLIPLIPLMMFVDALVSTIRTRTPKELERLVEQTGLDLAEWEFRSGQTLCIRPLLWTHWFIGVRKGPALDWK